MTMYLAAFVVGGLFALVGQLLFDLTNLSPGHVLTGFTVLGGIMAGLGLYEPLIRFAGAGATMPISSFGNSLAKGAIMEASRDGVVGVLTGMFDLTSAGITAAIVIGFLTSLVFNPKA